ncbi:MAG: DNA translocase FtsK 4TM domain-containing protein, partial [Magnetococcales bacterium]|nr:DNA translocase FtsK 4TM domain-containing protein [Magnetococcales bacterium]
MTTKRRPSPAPKADAPLAPGAQIVREALGLIMLFLGAFLLLTLLSHNPEDPSFNYARDNIAVHNLAGRTGALLSDGLYQAFGYGAFWLVFFLLVPGYRLLRSKPEDTLYLDRVMAAPMMALVTMTLHAMLSSATPAPDAFPPSGPGGVIGGAMAETMRQAFGLWGGLLLITPLGVLSLMVLLRVSFTNLIAWVNDLREISLPKPTSIPEARQMATRSGLNLVSKSLELSGKLIVGLVGIVAALPMLMHALQERLRASTPRSRPMPASTPSPLLSDPLPETRVEPLIDLPATPEPERRDLLAKNFPSCAEVTPVEPEPDATPPGTPPFTPGAPESSSLPIRTPFTEPITSASLFTGGRSEASPASEPPTSREEHAPKSASGSTPPVVTHGAPGVTIEKANLSLSMGGSATPGMVIEQPRISFSLGSAPAAPVPSTPEARVIPEASPDTTRRRGGVIFR